MWAKSTHLGYHGDFIYAIDRSYGSDSDAHALGRQHKLSLSTHPFTSCRDHGGY